MYEEVSCVRLAAVMPPALREGGAHRAGGDPSSRRGVMILSLLLALRA